jgi:hypothetical protein
MTAVSVVVCLKGRMTRDERCLPLGEAQGEKRRSRMNMLVRVRGVILYMRSTDERIDEKEELEAICGEPWPS